MRCKRQRSSKIGQRESVRGGQKPVALQQVSRWLAALRLSAGGCFCRGKCFSPPSELRIPSASLHVRAADIKASKSPISARRGLCWRSRRLRTLFHLHRVFTGLRAENTINVLSKLHTVFECRSIPAFHFNSSD